MINDTSKVEYSDNELINYTNDAIFQLSALLAQKRYPEMLKTISVTDGDSIPIDYYSFSGIYPFEVVSGLFELYVPTDTISVKYYATKPKVNNINDTMPFSDLFIPILLRVVCIHALNRNNYELSQDQSILTQVLALLEGGSV